MSFHRTKSKEHFDDLIPLDSGEQPTYGSSPKEVSSSTKRRLNLGQSHDDERNVRETTSLTALDVVSLDDNTITPAPPLVDKNDNQFRQIYNSANEIGQSRNILHKFTDNTVSTTKYTWWNFIPKNLYEQFHRLANFFFLVTAALTLVPGVTNITPVSSISPLVFVLGVTAAKEAYDDIKRARGDSEVNNTKVLALRSGSWEKIRWRDVVVGDIIKVLADEPLPVDLLLLNTSLSNGLCYVQTANLDGETNLKSRQARPETLSIISEQQLSNWNGHIECEQPNKDLYNFDGRIFMPGNIKPLSLDNNQLLLRGCILKNCDHVVGIVIFTGRDTKLRQNARDPPTKRSSLEGSMNKGLITLFILLFTASVLCALASMIYLQDKYWYLSLGDLSAGGRIVQFLYNLASYIILYSYMIPISLYVCMEVVKLCQTFLLEQDVNMYHEKSDTPAKAKTSSLIEELGQIDFIFSDKTGTLTSNEMELQKCTINGRIYMLTEPVVEDGVSHEDVRNTTFQSANLGNVEVQEFSKNVLNSEINEVPTGEEFFHLLSVCHSVLPEPDKIDPSKLVYQASSPDELALVQRAADMGFVFKQRTFDTVTIDSRGNSLTYEILNMIEFNSNRKRMSVIARCPDGNIRLYCKGADAVIVPRLLPEERKLFKETTDNQLEYFAAEGLRTLCCAYSIIPERDYEIWNERFLQAVSSLDDRKGKIDAMAEEIEKNLTMLGCTAIEDKLQDGVPEAIAQLRRANINIWVLTGDKQETAINIGLSCRLLTGVSLISLYHDDPDAPINEDTVKEELEKAIAHMEHQTNTSGEEFGLVIEGECLKYCLSKSENSEIQPLFMKLALRCKTVVCCRVSPSQKRGVVKAVKKTLPHVRTLSIGDGANDVSMIQEAHIGVGILGKEGTQAAMSSDYCVAQFAYLANMLLVHGRSSYIRTSRLVLYSFYKNAVLSVCLLLYAFFTMFSAQNLFDSNSLAGFNVAFAALPIIFFAILDQDVKADKVFAYPVLYRIGQNNEQFSLKLLWGWFLYGIAHAFIIFFGLLMYFDWGVLDRDGTNYDLWSLAIVGFTAVVLVVNLKVAVETNYWTWINYLGLAVTIGFWFFYSFVFSAIYAVAGDEYYVTQHLWKTSSFWFFIVGITTACLVPDITIRYVSRTYFPEVRHVVQEIQMEGRLERKKLRQKGFVVTKPSITMMPLNTSSAVNDISGRSAYTGYAFAQDDHTASVFSHSLSSLLKEKMKKRKEKKEARKKTAQQQ